MKLNDNQMLPLFVRDMKQMRDLLQAEQSELDIMRTAILHMHDQAYVNTADELLWRYEKIYDLSSKGLTLEERRKNVIAKINTQVLGDKKTVIEELKKLTGRIIEFDEFCYDYFIKVGVVQNDLSDAFVRAIRKYLDTVKPAHIGYELSLIRYEEYIAHIGGALIDSTYLAFEEVF